MTSTDTVQAAIDDLVIANHILAHEGVVDAFGHVSIRHPHDAGRFFLAQSRSPELVAATDIITFDLDCVPSDLGARRMYAERFIHGSIYQARPDVMAICHSHAHILVPFSVSDVPLQPIYTLAGGGGAHVPVWDIRSDFGPATNMLVTDLAKGHSLARTVAANSTCLLRGHGGIIATGSLRATVLASVAFMQNANMLWQARLMGAVNPLTEAECAAMTQTVFSPLVSERAWEYWERRARTAAKLAGLRD